MNHDSTNSPSNRKPEESCDEKTMSKSASTGTGAVVGAALGTVAGPLGAIAGAAIGAMAGSALSGSCENDAGEAVNPNDNYWRKNYTRTPGYKSEYTYDDDYSPAYRLGYKSRERYQGKTFDEVENDLSREWESIKAKSRLTWLEAKEAVRNAWNHVEKAIS